MAIIDNYTKEELKQIVLQSKSFKEVIDKIGYSTHSGNNHKTVKDRLNKYNIPTEHFTLKAPIIRTEENVFCENSTASQATLRRWFLKTESPYICSICGQEPLWQGKELTLILDHINGSNHDNRLENLRWVCPNCNQQLDTTGFTKMHSEKVHRKIKKYYCIDCGKEISKNSERCKECYSKKKALNSNIKNVTKEELKNLIRNMPFTQIAKNFNVTDNAIRKWCDKYQLPRTKKEINSYSDEEWEKI